MYIAEYVNTVRHIHGEATKKTDCKNHARLLRHNHLKKLCFRRYRSNNTAQTVYVFMLLVHGACSWCLFMVRVHGACSWCVFMGACSWCVFMLHVMPPRCISIVPVLVIHIRIRPFLPDTDFSSRNRLRLRIQQFITTCARKKLVRF